MEWCEDREFELWHSDLVARLSSMPWLNCGIQLVLSDLASEDNWGNSATYIYAHHELISAA
jgi:hypothetical protein